MSLEKLYVRSDLREYYERLLLEDARSDLKAQSIIESEYNKLMNILIYCNLDILPYYADPNHPELSGYHVQTNHIKYVFIEKGVIPNAKLGSETSWQKNIIYCPILNHPSTPSYKLTDAEISELNKNEYQTDIYHEIQHIIDKYRFANKEDLDKIPNEFPSRKAYHNYSPEMNGHVTEIIAQVKKEVLHILGFITSLEKFEDIRKRYQDNFKTALIDLHNDKDTFIYKQLNIKKPFVSDLRESNFYRLLQRVRAIIDKLFDDKKTELQQQGEK